MSPRPPTSSLQTWCMMLSPPFFLLYPHAHTKMLLPPSSLYRSPLPLGVLVYIYVLRSFRASLPPIIAALVVHLSGAFVCGVVSSYRAWRRWRRIPGFEGATPFRESLAGQPRGFAPSSSVEASACINAVDRLLNKPARGEGDCNRRRSSSRPRVSPSTTSTPHGRKSGSSNNGSAYPHHPITTLAPSFPRTPRSFGLGLCARPFFRLRNPNTPPEPSGFPLMSLLTPLASAGRVAS